jgi:hypothetical protein
VPALSYLVGIAQVLNTTTGATVASTPSPESVQTGTSPPGFATTSITTGSAVITAVNNLYAGCPVVFSGSLATVSGLVLGTTYWVSTTGLSSSQFEVSATNGGSVITMGGTGSATPNVAALGCVEIRVDQASLITDATVVGGLRPLKRGELYQLGRVLMEYYVEDTNLYQ